MDIKCERCGTEYEFDDSRVSEEGVTVKCSTCGHLFKIRKKSFVLTEPVPQEDGGAADGGKNWMVRRRDGTVLSFKELTTLQKWIVERRVSRDDEISKSGETWKRLGGIAELASFFQVVDQAMAATQPSLAAISLPPPPSIPPAPAYPPMSQPAMPAVSYPPPSQPAPMSQPPMSQPMLPAAQVMPPAVSYPPPMSQPAPMSQPSLPAVQPPAVSYPPPSQPAPMSQPVLPAAVPVTGRQEPDSWGPEAGAGATDDDVVEKWKRRGRRKWYFIVPLLLLVAGVGAFYLLAPEQFMGLVHKVLGKSDEPPALARAQYQSGLQAFLKDTEAGYTTAQAELDSAIKEAKGRFPAAMALLAEVQATRADRLAERIAVAELRVKELEAKETGLAPTDGKEPDAALKTQIAEAHNAKVEGQQELLRLQAEAQKAMEEAKRQLDGALEVDPHSFEALLAKANYLRVRGAGRDQIDLPLREAGALRPGDPGLGFVDGAALSEDQAALDMAVQKLSEALELQQKAGLPDLLRARYALARTLVRAKRPDDAKVQLERVLQASPDHEAAKALLASLQPPPEPPKPVEPPPAEPVKPAEPVAPAAPAAPTTFDGWMSLADGLQQKGRTEKALEAYEAALALKPGHAEALTGKGLCLLDLGSYPASIGAFKAALQTNPSYGDAILGLGEANKYKGDKAEAARWYQRYLDVHPNGPEASVAKSNLAELK
jgi:predicted Zn finger-like uncharacterized protein